MTKATSYIPAGQHTITPHLILKDASKAIEFYKKAFGAQEIRRILTPDGRIMHANIKIGDSHLYICDEFPEHGCGLSPQSLKNAHATIHLFVENADKVFQGAVEAGAQAIMPPADMFWGDRYGCVVDPFGQPWSIATHKEDLTPEELEKRKEEFCQQMATAKK